MVHRVVVTGVGMVTPVGNDAQTAFDAMVAGKNGIRRVTRFDPEGIASKIGGEVSDYDPAPFMASPKEVKRTDPFVHYTMGAGYEAFHQAGLDQGGFDPNRAGAIIGVGLGGVEEIDHNKDVLRDRGPRRVSPFFVPATISNLAPGHLSMKYNLRGPTWAPASACASGSHAIGEAFETIRHGRSDVILAGGAESAIVRLTYAGFSAMRALSTRNDEPELASRPFDKERDGFVMGEGAGVLVLESLPHAQKRGAQILCEVAGYGASSDAHHITAPAPGGEGAARCMQQALQEAELNPEQVDYLNAHGTSTSLNDAFETQAIKTVFAEHADKLWISSTKSMIGHLLGGAGGVEGVTTVLSIYRGVVHPTRNLTNPDPECDLDYVPGDARQRKIGVALSNSFGFGGTNASILFKRFE